MNKKFIKNDEGFVCNCCDNVVPKLETTSRDHCTICLCSIHVDVNPGDRQNPCHGQLVPIGIEANSKKGGYVINYKCEKCGKFHNNKAAPDDSFDTILSIMNGTYQKRLSEILNRNLQ